MKIAVLGSSYPRHHDDPAVPWLRKIVNRTAARGHEVTVIAPSHRGLRSHEIDGIRVQRYRYAPAKMETLTHDEGAPNKIHSPFAKLLAIPYILSGMLAVFRETKKHRYDVIHVHWPFPHGLMTLLPRQIFGIRVVAMCHGAELALGRKSGVIRKVLAFLLRSADEVCTNSSHTAAEVRKTAGDIKLHILPYGATVEAKTGTTENGEIPLLLFCGRLIQRKGIDYLLRAMPDILKRREVKLVITGEGDRKQEWQELARELQIDHAVEFAGFVSNERLADLYQTCSCYVHPAIYDDNGDTEGLGVVLVEALAHRKPVVACGVGGIVDVIKDEQTGLLVPEKSEAALSEAILRILDNPELAAELGQNGYEYARQVFCWDRIVRETESVYQKAINKGRKSIDLQSPQPDISHV